MRRNNKPSTSQEERRSRAFIDASPHTVALVVYPGCSIFDIGVVTESFSTANGQARRDYGIDFDIYKVEVVSSVAGPVAMEMGVKLVADKSIADHAGSVGTLVLAGGNWEPVEAAMRDRTLIAWIQRAARKADRVASMCTGAFLLAEAGLAKTTVTTHWAHCERAAALYPHLKVAADSIHVKEGNVYSSAGSTAAMDLALTLVEEDLGHKLAMNVARRLVMFLRRPGGQSQFSQALLAQAAESAPMRDLAEWITANLDEDLSVAALASRAAMSPRNFARVFLSETGLTPAKYVERARLERARQLVEETSVPLSALSRRAGFESRQKMRRAFIRWLGVTPAEYATRFGAAA